MGWLCVLETDRTRGEGKIDRQAEAGQKLGECEVKRIYIAGPMTGIEDLNGPEFDKASDYFASRDFSFFNPSHCAFMNGWDERTPLSAIAPVLLNTLMLCTHIYMLRGWEQSKGARAEHAVAVWIGLEIIYQGGVG